MLLLNSAKYLKALLRGVLIIISPGDLLGKGRLGGWKAPLRMSSMKIQVHGASTISSSGRLIENLIVMRALCAPNPFFLHYETPANIVYALCQMWAQLAIMILTIFALVSITVFITMLLYFLNYLHMLVLPLAIFS